LGVAAGAFALGAMAGHAVQGMRGQKGGWAKMGLDALSVLPGASGAKALVTAGKGARLTAGREALETGLHSGDMQKKIIQPAELGIAKRFGKELTKSQIVKMNQYSSLTVKSGATAFGASKQATS